MFACTVALVACSGNESTSNDSTNGSEQEVSFRFSWWGGDSRHEATLEVIDLYMEKNPNVTIIPEYAAWSGYQDKYTAQFSGGTTADLMQVNYNWLWIYSPEGDGYYNLNELSDVLTLSNYNTSLLDSMSIDKRVNKYFVKTAPLRL